MTVPERKNATSELTIDLSVRCRLVFVVRKQVARDGLEARLGFNECDETRQSEEQPALGLASNVSELALEKDCKVVHDALKTRPVSPLKASQDRGVPRWAARVNCAWRIPHKVVQPRT
jgi:hypothetical protein